ncbi:MAG: malic enzyme-like NAD(P)-binding protein [Kiritimatiellia bacterium]
MKITREEILSYHLGGKVGLRLLKELKTQKQLCMAYTPGVAEPVREIVSRPETVRKYTAKSNLVAVVSDGTAVLGLGDTGAAASIPVMEGKAVLFKAFGDVDGWPVPLARCRAGGRDRGPTDPERLIAYVKALEPMYGGINLEDIAAPHCFEIEDRLDAELDIPVFHDDQWGTAVITLAGVMNYCRLCGRDMPELSVVINGAGAAGIRIAEVLKTAGADRVTVCDSRGVIGTDRKDLTGKKREHAVDTDIRTVDEAMKNAHVFIGVSTGGCIKPEQVVSMAEYPAIFAMANPDPEILPEEVASEMKDRPYVMATGRSDYPNQVNNVLGFPFLFRGALDAGASTINMSMKIAAAEALAALAREPVTREIKELYGSETDLEFGNNYVIPKPFDERLFVEVPCAVAEAAVKSGDCPFINIAQYRRKLGERNDERRGLSGA